MTTMHNTPTIADTANLADATSQAACTATTWPPMSSNRFAGMLWSEKLMSQARAASNAEQMSLLGRLVTKLGA